MPAPRFLEQLGEQSIPIDRILLDPNNPRLATTTFETVREGRIARERIQRATLQKLNEGPYEMDRLRASIRRSGLLPMDRIVVRPVAEDGEDEEGEQLFVVVEGNRRIAAIKTLLEQHEEGELELEEQVVETLEEPTVLVLSEETAELARLDQWVIQGVRHITGIREWGGYQAARTIQTMIQELDYDEREVADALGLSLQRVRRSIRVLSGLDQMQEDEEYAEYAGPDLYAYFDEVIRRRKVRDWVGWDDSEYEFTNEDRARMLYAWITPDEELDGDRRVPTSGDVRNLDPVLDSDAALAVLNTPGATLQDAVRVAGPIAPETEWRRPVERAIEALRSMPMSVLEDMQEEDRELLEGIRDIAKRRLDYAESFTPPAEQ